MSVNSFSLATATVWTKTQTAIQPKYVPPNNAACCLSINLWYGLQSRLKTVSVSIIPSQSIRCLRPAMRSNAGMAIQTEGSQDTALSSLAWLGCTCYQTIHRGRPTHTICRSNCVPRERKRTFLKLAFVQYVRLK